MVQVAEDGLTVETFAADAYLWHPSEWAMDIDKIQWNFWHITSPEGGGSTSGVAVGVLVEGEGKWVVVEGSSDYTGWDCQSGAVWTLHNTLNDVVKYGLTNETRRLLGFGV